MSWDGIIMRLGNARSVQDLPSDFQPPPVGTSESIGELLRRSFAEADHRIGQSSIDGDGFWLEFNYGCHTDAAGMVSAIGIRSNAGKGCLEPLRRICDALHSRLFDCQTGELADLSEETVESMKTFSEWRDRAISERDGTS